MTSCAIGQYCSVDQEVHDAHGSDDNDEVVIAHDDGKADDKMNENDGYNPANAAFRLG
jgi:hypothetical protein